MWYMIHGGSYTLLCSINFSDLSDVDVQFHFDFRQECSPELPGQVTAAWRIPSSHGRGTLGTNDPSQMWSKKRSLLVFVDIKLPSCLMSQNLDKLPTASSKLSSLIVRSGPAVQSTDEAGRRFLTVCAQKCERQWVTEWHVLSFPPPFTFLV